MSTPYARVLLAVMSVAANLFFVGCSLGDIAAPVAVSLPRTQPFSPRPFPVRITVFGQPTIDLGLDAKYKAIARLSDSTDEDFSLKVKWTSSTQSIDSIGQVTTSSLGEVRINASLGDFVGSTTVRVIVSPLPWEKFTPITTECKVWAEGNVLTSTRAMPGLKDTVSYWTQAGIDSAEIQAVVDFWKVRYAGKYIFIPALDSASARIRTVIDNLLIGQPASVCGTIEPIRDEDFVTQSVIVKVRFGCSTRALIAHEWGHALGLGHTPENYHDLMASVVYWRSSDFLDTCTAFLRAVPSGQRLQ